MKTKIYSLLISSIFIFTCCEDRMDDKHNNPDAFTKTEIEYLFSRGALNALENDYSDSYYYNFRLLGNYIQVTSRREGQNRINLYDVQDDKTRWENYYVKRMSTLTEIDKIYSTLSPEEQQNYRIYVEAGKILKAYNTALTTDLFGNMPYSEAFTARNPLYGIGEVIFRPKYDTQKEIYYTILDELKTAAEYFKTSPQTNATFERQDIVYNGKTNGWYKFANSLRLRYAMRISNVDEAKAKEVISSLSLENLITDNKDNTYIKVQGQSNAVDGIWRAMNENHTRSQGYYLFAPEKMVNIQKEAGDPRLQVFFQPPTDDEGNIIEEYKDAEIIGYPSSADDAIAKIAELGADKIMNTYAVYNSTTFRKNYYLPVGVGITAAEVYFLLAEAANRGIYSGNAEDLYNKGIIASVQNYYDYYANSDADYKDPAITQTDISEATLSTWISNSSYKYNASKAIEQIATQKWMHLGILQIYENWAEYRRTDLPVLDDDRESNNLLNKENAPVRLMYSSKEASMNTENYNAQSQYNDPHVRLWWDVK